MANKPFIEVCIDPDGVNGDIFVFGDYDGPEIRVIVTRGPDREVIHDSFAGLGVCRHCGTDTDDDTDVCSDCYENRSDDWAAFHFEGGPVPN